MMFLAQHQLLKLDELEADFKLYLFAIIDLDQQADKQDVLDKHDDRMSCIASRIQRLVTAATSPESNDMRRHSHQLLHNGISG